MKHGTKFFATVCTLALAATLGATTASAASGERTSPKTAAAMAVSNAKEFSGHLRTALTDEQKAEMQAKMKKHLKQQLDEGKITKAKYNEMLQAIKDGKMPIVRGDKEARKELTDEQRAQMQIKMKERLKQQLDDGKITKAKYNEMLQEIKDGKMPMIAGRGSRGAEAKAKRAD